MIPQPRQTLTDLAIRMATHILPDMHSAYGQADAGLISMLLMTLAQDYERAAFNRVTDIEAMQGLFTALPDGAPGKTKRSAYAQATPDSMQLADLTRFHALGFEILIDVHAWAEQSDQTVNEQIWQLLDEHAQRNAFDVVGP